MGTFYKLTETTEKGEFGIDEMSNRLTLVHSKKETWDKSNDLSPKELASVLLYGLTVCSYWMDSDELKEMILKHAENELY